MKETIKTAFKRGHIYLIFCLCGTALLNLMPLPCFGVVTSYSEPVVSITANNEPLRKVLDKISRATGYQIEVTNGWENKSITVNIQDLTLDNSLKKVVRALGRPSNIIERYDNTKTIKIKIYSTLAGSSSVGTSNINNQKSTQQMAQIVTEKSSGNNVEVDQIRNGLTSEELDNLKNSEDAKHEISNPMEIKMSDEELNELKKSKDSKHEISNPMEIKMSDEELNELKKSEDSKHEGSNPLGIKISDEGINNI